jgi:hypothetical protein
MGIRKFSDYVEEHTPHIVQEVVCLSCLYRWIAVRPHRTLLKELVCPKCEKCGNVIATGQEIDEVE